MGSLMLRERKWTFLVGLLGLALFVFAAAVVCEQSAQAAPFGRSAMSRSSSPRGLSSLLGVQAAGDEGIAVTSSGRPVGRPTRPWVSPTQPW